MKEIVLAAFKVTEIKSVAYKKYKTIKGFVKGIARVIEELEPDYISVRIIKEGLVGEKRES